LYKEPTIKHALKKVLDKDIVAYTTKVAGDIH
jgi:hypothetical protein